MSSEGKTPSVYSKGKTTSSATIIDLNYIYRNSHISKSRHFKAAERLKRLHNRLNVFIAFVNILSGSMFFMLVSIDLPRYAKWIIGLLALLSALASWAINSYNFNKEFIEQRTVGNKYLQFAREVELVLGQYSDNLITLEEISKMLPSLYVRYHNINVEAERLYTSQSDYQKAKEKEIRREQRFSDLHDIN